MAQSPSASSPQYSVLAYLPSTQAAGSIVHVVSEDGQEIVTFAPSKAYQTLVLSSDALEKGTSYTIYVGGSASGTETDGLYVDGTYTGGAAVSSFTVSSIVTGQSTGMMGGGMRGGGRTRQW